MQKHDDNLNERRKIDSERVRYSLLFVSGIVEFLSTMHLLQSIFCAGLTDGTFRK
jgi:hypothetical protein